ncbi:MAG: CBS domain-containing protein [Peptococcaceae bacterium]|nr:CBS domain-containing protein [Peptococcaceae bacterium]
MRLLLAGEIMSREFMTVDKETPVREAAGRMVQNRASFALVLDDSRRPAGIITESDLLKLLAPGSVRFMDMIICLDRGCRNREQFFPRTRLEEVMTRPVQYVSADTPVERVIATILEKGVKQLPVLENGMVAGVIRQSDLIRTLYRAAGG